MQRIIVATLLGLAVAGPAAAQVPNMQQMLQGLTSGNQNQDRALQEAFERGYQRGRQDEARQQTPGRGGNDSFRRGSDDSGYDRSRDGRGYEQPSGRQGNSYSR